MLLTRPVHLPRARSHGRAGASLDPTSSTASCKTPNAPRESHHNDAKSTGLVGRFFQKEPSSRRSSSNSNFTQTPLLSPRASLLVSSPERRLALQTGQNTMNLRQQPLMARVKSNTSCNDYHLHQNESHRNLFSSLPMDPTRTSTAA
jgi:hypothetical protein